jgi:glycosyltransferase involved in cell wall biosynthesis/O-antigen ligase
MTVGRALILLAAALVALDVHSTPRPRIGLRRAVWLFIVGIGAVWAWVTASAETWGCGTCGGDLYGLSELAAVCVLTAVACSVAPALRSALVVAVFASGALEAALALVGVHGLAPGTADTSTVQGRIAGTFGNPNDLATALSFSVPAGLVLLRIHPSRWRPAIVGALVLIVVALLLTLSRSGLLAAAGGAAIVLTLIQPPRSARRRTVLAGLLAAAAVTVIGYPLFTTLREHAETRPVDPALRAVDRSGWDGQQRAMIGSGGAGLANPAIGELEVRTSRPRQGVSHWLGTAVANGSYEVAFEVRALSGSAELGYGLENDGFAGNGPVVRHAAVSERWERLAVRWRPAGSSPLARFFVWSANASPGFVLRNVAFTARPLGDPATERSTIDTRLEGSVYAELVASNRRLEQRDIDSRTFAIRASLSAFAAEPLRGIGWGRFVYYSAAHGPYGDLPTHDEYLRFLAELGVIGVVLLAFVVVVVARAAFSGTRDELGLAVVGLLGTGTFGLLFINGLVAPAVMMPLGFAAAVACARAGVRPPALAPEAGPWWPAHSDPLPEPVPERHGSSAPAMNGRPRVLHLLPQGRALGGTERTVLDLLESPHLAHIDQRVAFVRPGRALGFPGASVLGGGAGFVAALPAILRWRPQILHCWLLQGNVVGALVANALPSARLITSERNVGLHAHPRLKVTLERFVARVEDVATGNSAAVRDAAVSRVPRRASRFRVILPGVAALPSVGPPRAATAVIVGRLHPVKDHVTALRAWQRVVAVRPEATLAIVGGGPRRRALGRLAHELRLDGAVNFRGETDPGPDLCGARMFLLSSQGEGFSRAVIEALAAGLPVVATDVGGMTELRGEAVRVVPIGDHAALAAHVLAWLDDPDALAHAALAARTAADGFMPATCHLAYAHLYAELGAR